jgi:growth hormone secretagogue receptor
LDELDITPAGATAEELETFRFLQSIYNAFNLYFPPVLTILGIFGNIVSLFVLNLPSYRKTSTGLFMISLAICDLNLVSNCLTHHYLRRNFGPVVVNRPFCRSLLFFLFGGNKLSNWVILFMTFDRTVAVVFPLKALALCTKFRAKLSVATISVINIFLSLPGIIWGEPQYLETFDYWTCDIVLEHKYYNMYYIHTIILDNWLLFLLLLVANLWISWTVARSRARRQRLFGDQDRSASREATLTAMLLANSFTFLLFWIPYQIDYFYWTYIVGRDLSHFDFQLRIMSWNITYVITYINPTINFYIYCLSSSKFRKEVYFVISSFTRGKKRCGLH